MRAPLDGRAAENSDAMLEPRNLGTARHAFGKVAEDLRILLLGASVQDVLFLLPG